MSGRNVLVTVALALGLVGGGWGQEGAGPVAKPASVRVPAGFRAAPGTAAEPYTKTGCAKEIIHEKTGVAMVFIPAGEFMMGSPDSEQGRYRHEGPQRRVRMTKPFYMGKYEVTQGEWQKVMGKNPSRFKGNDRLPVEMVSWNDCQEFVKKAGDGLRLPTEAEWEYACRAGTTTRFCSGDADGDLDAVGWYVNNSGGETHPVGGKPPNAWGLYDIHGNVSEWCQDRYDEKHYASSPASDPQGPTTGRLRVLRGGSWYSVPRYCRSASRGGNQPADRGVLIGFRVVVE